MSKANRDLMLIIGLIKRKPRMILPELDARLLSPDEGQSLLNFVRWGLGDSRLTAWEERFLSDRHQDLYDKAVWMTNLREVKVREIEDKLGYDRGEVPAASPDPDGEQDYKDADGWSPGENVPDPVEDAEQAGCWPIHKDRQAPSVVYCHEPRRFSSEWD
jgi:hypothetical protein